MQRKVFIGIDLPTSVKKRLSQKIEKWQDLPVLWANEDNFHVTLQFLGYLDDDTISEICGKMKALAGKSDSFDIRFRKIALGPNTEKAKMIWAIGDASEELKNLEESVEKKLGIFSTEKRAFRPHITLGRIRKNKWEEISPKPEIEEKFDAFIPVESLVVFESVFEDGKRKYVPMEICKLR